MPDIKTPHTAMVFAAGFGTRMRPLTLNTPKPLINLNNKPLIDYTLDALAAAGVERAIVNTHYLAGQIENHLAGRQKPAITISYEAPEILETGGGIVKALPFLGGDAFFVLNTDTLCVDKGESSLIRLASAWRPDQMDALLLLAEVEGAVGYDGKGDFNLLPDGTLKRELEGGECRFVYSGIMIIKPEIFKSCEEKAFSIFRDFLFKEQKYNLENGAMPRLHGIIHKGKWLHVGTPEAVQMAEDAMNRQN